MGTDSPDPYKMAQFLSAETKAELASVAQRLARAGCGVLAADETPMAMEDRFKDLDVENSAEVRYETE